LQKNEIYTVEIQSYTDEGFGVARIEQAVVFVQGAVRGDVCEIRILKVLKTLAYARIERLLTPSPQRITPECAVFPKCGGCCFHNVSYTEELTFKLQKVQDAMRRIGGAACVPEEIIGADSITRYRNKAQYPIRLKDGHVRYGFYRHNSHDIVSCTDCVIQSTVSNRLCTAVCEYMERFHVAPYDELQGTGVVRHVYVRDSKTTGEAFCCIVATTAKFPKREVLIAALRDACPGLTGVIVNINRARDNVILGKENVILWGRDEITDVLCGLKFHIHVHSFYQVNPDQTHKLYGLVRDYARSICNADRFTEILDLYCGVGTIGLTLADLTETLVGVEIVPEAVENARRNAAENGITNAQFLCGDAGAAAQHFLQQGHTPDLIVVDPPRKGLDAATIAAIQEMAPPHVIYVSCNPATLARDLKAMDNYKPEKFAAVDMFPRSCHCECCVLLRRTDR